jgi:hypothetical protein
MTEAVDDVARIVAVCDRQAVTRRRIHVDAALSGIPLSLLPEPLRPSFDFASGATSMVVSGHKFLSTLMSCGILIYARSPYAPVGGRVTYIGCTDTTHRWIPQRSHASDPLACPAHPRQGWFAGAGRSLAAVGGLRPPGDRQPGLANTIEPARLHRRTAYPAPGRAGQVGACRRRPVVPHRLCPWDHRRSD